MAKTDFEISAAGASECPTRRIHRDRHRQMIDAVRKTRRGARLRVRRPARHRRHGGRFFEEVDEVLPVGPCGAFAEMLQGHERTEFFARGRGDKLVDRDALLGGTGLQLLGQTLRHADGQCAHVFALIFRRKSDGDTLTPNFSAPRKSRMLWVIILAHRAATGSSRKRSSSGSGRARRQRK